AVAYVRPHDIEVDREPNGESALAAQIVHILSVGPIVRLEIAREENQGKNLIQVEISKERFRGLQLEKGDRVYIKPRRLDLFPHLTH
ncbi:MAG TPA: TOBE-like domain-containing protein, partial [Nitrosomonas sp.]|nr:TOBE-like domain-containing protein [Nitrosomonas sp.]